MRLSALSLVACVLFGPLVAQLPQLGAALTVAVERQVARDGIPGISAGIVRGDEVVWLAGFGFADLENEVPATPQTVYRLASISKPVTAVLALQLHERGELDLDRSVHEILAQWPEKPWPVTTRHLLAHLGGVRHYRGEGESTLHYDTQTAALVRFAADDLLHEPGTRFHYSTYGFNLVAAVLEARTGEPFPELVKERIAAPLGASTLQDDDVRRIIRGRAQGYVRVDGALCNSELMDGSYKLGGGGLCASAEDLLRFARALMAGELLSPATLATMWEEQRTKAGEGTGYGLGVRVERGPLGLEVSHSGAQSRVSTMLLMLPERRVAVVLLCNLERVRLAPLSRELATLVADAGK
jgi:serine beta-lactamase-like protein LACTB, mitochondrial